MTKQKFYYKHNRLQQLRGFCYTAQFGNITAAAKHMGVSHSSVSLQIKALSDDLGVKLYTRQGPRITLTKEGNQLLAYAQPLLDQIQNLQEVFNQELLNQRRTELRIAVNQTSKIFLLPPVVTKFIKDDPSIHFTLQHAEHDEAMRLLREDKVDCALLPRRDHKPFPEEYRYVPVYFYHACLITRPDHPLAGRRNLSIEEISRHELTLPDRDLRVISSLYDVFPQHKINKRLRVNFINSETGPFYIAAGAVITISSDVWVRPGDGIMATPLPHLFEPVDYGFVMRHDRVDDEKISQLISIAHHQAMLDKRSRGHLVS